MMPEKRILIVDDHTLVREGLKHLIDAVSDLRVVGEANSATQTLRLTEELKPDCLTLDLSLPDKSGLRVLEAISRSRPHLPILVVSMHSQSDKVVEAFQAGASGYVLKESAADRLIEGIRTVLRGEKYLDASLSRTILETLLAPDDDKRGADSGYATLSLREQEVLRLLAEGLSTKEIGKLLYISSKTVDNHRANLMKKLALETTVDIVRYAAKLGLIDIDLWK